MLIVENKELPEKVLGILRKRVHYRGNWYLTDLLRCPRVTYWLMIGEQPHYTDGKLLTFSRGKAHHGVLEVFPLKEIRREKDGIRGDIDMIGDRITEIFTTTMSTNKIKSEEDVVKVFSTKVAQLMGYLYMSGEGSGDLLVFFLFGDYSRFTETPLGLSYTGIEPELKSWTLYFEESELKDNWDEIIEKRDMIEMALKEKKVPEMKGYDYECNDCAFGYICDDAKRVDGVDVGKAKETLRQLEWAVESIKEKERGE